MSFRVARFTVLPQTLYRIQANMPVKLRDFDTQQKLNRTSFDLKIIDGLVRPAPPGDDFSGPNGMSVRPSGENMRRIVDGFKGNPTVYTLPVGLKLPESLICLHEHTDHFSIQVRQPMTFDAFNAELTKLLEAAPRQTIDQYRAAANDVDDQDN